MKYLLQKSEQKSKHWVCTDKINKIVVVWESKKFNATQKITMLDDFDAANYMKLARIQRELAEWLMENHPNKI